MNTEAVKETLREVGKFLGTGSLLCAIIFLIHELGHVVAQLLFGVPVILGFDFAQLGLSTTSGVGITGYPPYVFYPVVFAGLVASLIPIMYLKSILWLPDYLKVYMGPDRMKTILYVAICITFSNVDIGLAFKYAFL